MNPAIRLFDSAIKKGAEIFLLVEKLNDADIEKSRMDICLSCDFYDAERDKCKGCGCYMKIKTTMLKNINPKAKGRIEITHCPEGKWDDKEISNYYRKLDGKKLLT